MIVNAHTELPPELMRGNGMPMMGSKPMVMPMLIKKWEKMMPAMP
jgi:hypothetical protein